MCNKTGSHRCCNQLGLHSAAHLVMEVVALRVWVWSDSVLEPHLCCLQVKGYSNIFAVGDAVDVDDDHLAYQALNHGKLVGKSIVKLMSNPDAKLPLWKRNGGFRLAALVLGPKNVLALIGAKTCFTYVPSYMSEQKLKATRSSVGL